MEKKNLTFEEKRQNLIETGFGEISTRENHQSKLEGHKYFSFFGKLITVLWIWIRNPAVQCNV